MSEDLILFWHRRDLRIDDNLGLFNACEYSSKVVGLFCLDPNILNRDDIAPVRVHYMIGRLLVKILMGVGKVCQVIGISLMEALEMVVM